MMDEARIVADLAALAENTRKLRNLAGVAPSTIVRTIGKWGVLFQSIPSGSVSIVDARLEIAAGAREAAAVLRELACDIEIVAAQADRALASLGPNPQ